MVAPIELVPEQQKELRRQSRRAVGRVAERIQYVLLFARGYPIAEIATLYQVDEETVTDWLRRFHTEGVDGLSDRPRSGRPRRASAAAEAEALRCLESSPAETGAERTTWTRRLLQRHLEERFDCWLSLSSVKRLIARLDFVWRRPKLTVKPQPAEEAARQALRGIVAAVADAFPQMPLLFGDEADLHQLPVVRGEYQRRGSQREVPTPGSNARQGVFGFLEVRAGEWHYFLKHRKRSKELIECLHELNKHYGQRPFILFVDQASIHQSELTLRWLERHPNVVLFSLPAYSGHKCNPVEKVWWALKDACAANCLYPSLEAVQDAIHGFFSRFTRQVARQLTASYLPLTRNDQPEPLSQLELLPLAA